MTVAYVILGLLPGIALVGPLLIGRHFGVDWILKVGLGFDGFAILLGVGSLWLTHTGGAGASIGARLLVYLGAGMVGFGLLFGAITAWFLFADEGS